MGLLFVTVVLRRRVGVVALEPRRRSEVVLALQGRRRFVTGPRKFLEIALVEGEHPFVVPLTGGHRGKLGFLLLQGRRHIEGFRSRRRFKGDR